MAASSLGILLRQLTGWAGTSTLMETSDAKLLERFVAHHEEAAFAALLRRHGPMVLSVCRRALSNEQDREDVFQATFLLLAGKAGSIRRGESVGSWLHGVAHRLAVQCRRQESRRRLHEQQAGRERAAAVPVSEAWDELRVLLDEAIAELPEKYRAALVLCYLEGHTHEQAARRLGCPLATLRSRVARGRERLRATLVRRGLTLSGAAFLAVLATNTVEAALPVSLRIRTLMAALQFAKGEAVSALVSASSAALVEGGLRAMTTAKLKGLLVLLLTVGLTLGSAGLLAHQILGAKNPAEPPQAVDEGAASPAVESKPKPAVDRFGDPLPAGAVARIGTVRWWCGGFRGGLVNTLVYLPDGKSLLCCGVKDTVHFLDAATGKELRRIVMQEEGRQPAFTLAPNGKTLVTANLGSPVLHIWDVTTGKELRRIENVKRGVDSLAFSPDGKTFVVGTHADLWLWDTATWREIHRITGKDVGHYNGIFFLGDGKTLISGFSARISWWDTATGQLIRHIGREKYGSFSPLAVSADRKRLAAFGYGTSNRLVLWDAVTGEEIRRVEFDSRYFPRIVCFSLDSRILVCSGSEESSLKASYQTLFFAADTGQELRRWDESDTCASQLAFSPDGKMLAQAMSGVIRLRDVKTGKPIVPVSGLPNSCLALRFSRDGQALMTGCRGGQTGTWNPLSGEPLSPLRDPPEGFGRQAAAPIGTALSAGGESAALVNADGVLHVWEPATGNVCCRIADPLVTWDHADFAPDGKSLTLKHQDNIIRLWDARSGKLLRSFPRIGGVRTPHPRAFSPDGRTLAIGPAFPDNRIIHLYETATGKEIGRLVWGDSTDVNDLLFTPDGKTLLAAHRRQSEMEGGPKERGDEEDGLRFWDRASGREVRRIPMPVHWDQAMVLSPDGKTLAVSVGDSIILWELASGSERGRFSGHREWVRSLAFSPNGRLLASGSYDHTACVWDATGICPDGKWFLRPVKQEELERLWTDLGKKDGVGAYRAIWRLASSGPAAVAFLSQRLRPIPRVEAERLTRLVADLDSDRFETRERASAELRRLNEQAEASLRKALAAKPSLEMSRRLRALLEPVEKGILSAEQLHALRAVEVLEHIGTVEARRLLRELAKGVEGTTLTLAAQAALTRLEHSPAKGTP